MNQRHHICNCRGTHRLRWIGKTPSGPKGDNSRSDTTASHSPSHSRPDRCVHIHLPKGSIPIRPDASSAMRLRPHAKALDQVLHVGGVAANSEAKTRFPLLPIRQIEGDLHRAARVQPAPTLRRDAVRFKRHWLRQVSVPAQKFFSIPVRVRAHR